MLDIAIEELTNILIKQFESDKENNKEEMVYMSKQTMIKKFIKALKLIQREENY